jgi:hypothetical protein
MRRSAIKRIRVGYIVLGAVLAATLACSGGGSLTTPAETAYLESGATQQTTPAPAALPTRTEVPKPTTASETTMASGAAPAGTYTGFRSFAAEIDAVLRRRDAVFLGEHASNDVWDCLGDETQGVCSGQPAGSVLEGIPVTQRWMTYAMMNSATYEATWRQAFEAGATLSLHATAHRNGDNPLMPFETDTFYAVVTNAAATDVSKARNVGVLLFEYRDLAWWFQGELQPGQDAKQWVSGSCDICYDEWTP